MLSSVFATNIAGQHILGLQGWRVAFLTVAAVSAAAGAAMWAAARDPRCSKGTWGLDPAWQPSPSSSSSNGGGSSSGGILLGPPQGGRLRQVLLRSSTAREVWDVVTTPSFIVVVLQVREGGGRQAGLWTVAVLLYCC
jgi:hypothetical protein